jgi:hypothetical protein
MAFKSANTLPAMRRTREIRALYKLRCLCRRPAVSGCGTGGMMKIKPNRWQRMLENVSRRVTAHAQRRLDELKERIEALEAMPHNKWKPDKTEP